MSAPIKTIISLPNLAVFDPRIPKRPPAEMEWDTTRREQIRGRVRPLIYLPNISQLVKQFQRFQARIFDGKTKHLRKLLALINQIIIYGDL